MPVRPPPAFAGARLVLHTTAAGERFGRIYPDRCPAPLGFGKTPSRFSDPRRRIERNRFGVFYLGETLKVCVLEAVLRDGRDGMVGDLPIAEEEFHNRRYAEIEAVVPLRLVDLHDDGAVVMGIPSDVHRARRQSLGRVWSVAIHDHPSAPDGIIYPSRLNGHTNLAIYDHAVVKLKTVRVRKLIAAPDLAAVLDDFSVSIVVPDAL